VLKDAARLTVDRWWALGDLVLFGPRPAEVLELLQGLPGISMLRRNADRYVLTGEQPDPHATAAESAHPHASRSKTSSAWPCEASHSLLYQADPFDFRRLLRLRLAEDGQQHDAPPRRQPVRHVVVSVAITSAKLIRTGARP
jgi:hypothetical protein